MTDTTSRKRPREEEDDEDDETVIPADEEEEGTHAAKILRSESKASAADDALSSQDDEDQPIIVVEKHSESAVEIEVKPPQFSLDGLRVSETAWTKKIDSCYSHTEPARRKANQYINKVSDMMLWSREHQDLLRRIVAARQQPVQPIADPFDADVIIEVGSMYTNKRQYHGFFVAHKFMLTQSCEYFSNMFNGPWVEAQQSQAPYVIQKPNATPASIQAVLQYLYAGVVGPVSLDTIKDCFLLAHELMLSEMITDLVAKLVYTDPKCILADNTEAFIHLYSFFKDELSLSQDDDELVMLFFEPLLHGRLRKRPDRFAPANSETIATVLQYDEARADEHEMCLATIGWALAKIGFAFVVSSRLGTAELDQVIPLVNRLTPEQRTKVRDLIREPLKHIRWGCIDTDWFKTYLDGKELMDTDITLDAYRVMIRAPSSTLRVLDSSISCNERDGYDALEFEYDSDESTWTHGLVVNNLNFMVEVSLDESRVGPDWKECSVSLVGTPTKVENLNNNYDYNVQMLCACNDPRVGELIWDLHAPCEVRLSSTRLEASLVRFQHPTYIDKLVVKIKIQSLRFDAPALWFEA